MIFANVQMTRVPLTFNGVKQRQDIGGWYYATVPGVCGVGITIGTMGAVTGLGVFCDESSMKDPEKFVEIYEEKFFEIVKRLKVEKS